MDVLHTAGNSFNAFEDRIPGLDHRHEFLIEHDEILIFDLLLKRESGNPDFFPVQFDG